MSLGELERRIKQCKECRLWKGARNAVPGEGPSKAQVMLVGQNPGEEEDRTGKPFVGRAGKFLNTVLEKNQISRERLFITNVVKHKTPQNRAPRSDEIRTCLPYLTEQIAEIGPKIIVLMGRVAQQTPRKGNIEYIPTCHPAAAMRFPKMREKFEKDFITLKKLLSKE